VARVGFKGFVALATAFLAIDFAALLEDFFFALTEVLFLVDFLVAIGVVLPELVRVNSGANQLASPRL
jgi:hypothetical protein